MADARNRKNVLTGAPDIDASGGIEIGKTVTKSEQIPKTVDDELNTELEMKPAGYVSSDGITKTVDRETEKIKDWNGDTVIVLTTEHSVILKLTFLESANAEVLKMVAGEENVEVLDDGTLKVVDNAEDLPHRSMNFTIKGQSSRKIRVFAPDAQVTNVGDVVFVRSDIIKYEVEIECFTDPDANKLYAYISPHPDDAASSGSPTGPIVGPGGGD